MNNKLTFNQQLDIIENLLISLTEQHDKTEKMWGRGLLVESEKIELETNLHRKIAETIIQLVS